MVEFHHSYYHPLDREYERVYLDSDSRPMYHMSPRDIGISTPPFKDQLETLQARIRQGASTIELGFSGAGKGSMGGGNTTPEMVPKWQREAIRELAKINKLRLSTHATFAAGSLAGFQQNHFDEGARERSLHEIKRAIEFAADTTQGGPIVTHLGEFPRSIYESFHKEGFRGFEEEEKHAQVYLVDKRTGEIVTGLSRSTEIPWPKFAVDKSGKEVLDEDGQPVPIFNPKSGVFETQMVGWNYFEQKAKNWNREHPEKNMSPAQMFFHAYQDAQERQAKGMAKYWSRGYEESKRELDDLNKAKAFYEEVFSHISPTNRKNWAKVLPHHDPFSIGITPDLKDPLELIDQMIQQAKHNIEHIKETSLSYSEQIQQINAKKQNVVPMEEFGLKKTADTIARAAEYAYDRSRKLPEPLFIAPENVFPEQYGSHPEELKQIILAARERFTERMHQKGMAESQAKKLAEEHIKATFDIGHAFTWKKYFQGDPKKSYEENEKEFKKWLMDKVKDLNQHKIIGHVHVSDNFGYEDEHVTPGQGIVPIKEFLEEMKHAGIKRIIVEPAHQDFEAVLGGWKEFGGSIYRGAAPAMGAGTWTDVQGSYFGKTRSPYFVFGEYSPSQDFSLWTGIQLE